MKMEVDMNAKHPGGKGKCIHCGKLTGAWCAHCRSWACATTIRCMEKHEYECASIAAKKKEVK